MHCIAIIVLVGGDNRSSLGEVCGGERGGGRVPVHTQRATGAKLGLNGPFPPSFMQNSLGLPSGVIPIFFRVLW